MKNNISLTRSMGVDVSDDDGKELVKKHKKELTTKYPKEIAKEKHKYMMDGLSKGLEK